MEMVTFLKNNKQLLSKLSLTFGMFLVASIGFAMLADEVHEGDTLHVDVAILTLIHSQASSVLDSFFALYTEIGGVMFVGIVTMIVVSYLWLTARRYRALLLFFAVGGAAVVNYMLKFIFERARPDLWTHIVEEASFSFPSGHAMGSSAFAFGIVAILWNTKWRLLSIIIATFYVVSIGFSRLYLGVHYPTDIVAGWLLSLVWVAFIASFVYIRMHRKGSTQRSVGNDRQQ